MFECDPRIAEREGYQIFRLAGHPVIAFSSGPRRVRLAGASRIQGYTLKRAMLRHLLRAAVASGLDRLIIEHAPDPLGPSSDFNFALWLRQATRELGAEGLTATVIWPLPLGNTRSRLYVHLLDHSGQPIAFAKISFDEAENEGLHTEARMLKTLSKATLQHFKVPTPFFAGFSQGHYYLMVEAAPTTARPIGNSLRYYPARAVAEIASTPTMVGSEAIFAMPWWNRFLKRYAGIPRFIDEVITSLKHRSATLCRIQGDFAAHNLMRDGRTLWIVDWEQGTEAGPQLTDPLRYYLATRKRDCYRRPAAVLNDILHREVTEESSQRRLDVGMALAYLHGARISEATQLLRSWHSSVRG